MIAYLNILEKVEGIENIKEKQDIYPGRKKEKEIINYDGYPSRYRLSYEFVIIKNLFKKSEFLLLFRKFINSNQLIKNYLIFTLNTIYFNSSKLINKKIKSDNKEKLKKELIEKVNAQQEDITPMISLLLLFGSREDINNLSNSLIDGILSSNDYTFILFLIKLSSLINKL
jgi:hypothetical protein